MIDNFKRIRNQTIEWYNVTNQKSRGEVDYDSPVEIKAFVADYVELVTLASGKSRDSQYRIYIHGEDGAEISHLDMIGYDNKKFIILRVGKIYNSKGILEHVVIVI